MLNRIDAWHFRNAWHLFWYLFFGDDYCHNFSATAILALAFLALHAAGTQLFFAAELLTNFALEAFFPADLPGRHLLGSQFFGSQSLGSQFAGLQSAGLQELFFPIESRLAQLAPAFAQLIFLATVQSVVVCPWRLVLKATIPKKNIRNTILCFI